MGTRDDEYDYLFKGKSFEKVGIISSFRLLKIQHGCFAWLLLFK